MYRFKRWSSRRASLAILAATLTTTPAGAATLHRFAITQTTGSEGAQAVLQTSVTGSALQGEVSSSSANTSVKFPFGVLGEYDASGSKFGIGTLGISTRTALNDPKAIARRLNRTGPRAPLAFTR